MRGIIKALINLLIERDLLILEDSSQIELLCTDIFEAMQNQNQATSLGAWLSNQLIQSPYVAELFASDKELNQLWHEL